MSSHLNHDNRARYVLFPLQWPKIWDAYKQAQKTAWIAEEIHLGVDRLHWKTFLTQDERKFLSIIFTAFAAFGRIIMESLVHRFCAEVDIPEARCFYSVQMTIENVHAEVYSRFVHEILHDSIERQQLSSALNVQPVKAKTEWCLNWLQSSTSDLPTRVVALAVVEGIFLSSSFATVFWFGHRGLIPGVARATELISRDEGRHTRFACLLYKELDSPVPEATVHAMILEAVELEHAFFAFALPRAYSDMNVQLMRDYVEFIADQLLSSLGFTPLFYSNNPVCIPCLLYPVRR
ncbi:putative ribonucleoside-diphosphate reductase small chain B [Earliella scabrosa]|nr:putative ribonucleoside-diphosphate reductase small chain B [Earliella scabrosa]